jgi:HTH-type transcriptional regulator/antitoxin HigA
MMVTRLIKTEAEYERALKRIDVLMGAPPETPQFDELELLAALVELYEEQHDPVLPPDPVDAIKFRAEQAGLAPKQLAPLFGSRAKVSEVLSGKRPLTLSMIRALHEKLGIPAEILLREPGATLPDKIIPHPEKLPWKVIVHRGWLGSIFRGTPQQARDNAEELATHLFRNFPKDAFNAARFRRNVRGQMDQHALLAWTARLINVAAETLRSASYQKATVNEAFMQNLVSLSFLEDGPRLAKEFLLKSGIVLVIEQHLPRTHVDGAAMMLDDGTPIIGLSLRYDRLDNFWFTLAHELAHICLHLDHDSAEWFADDLDAKHTTKAEREADEWAQNHFIPTEALGAAHACQSATQVEALANKLRVSPAIIAGRIRHDSHNWKLCSRLIGQGEPSRILGIH